MEYLGYIVLIGKILVSTKKVEGVKDWPVQLLHQAHLSFQRSYGSNGGLTTEVLPAEGHANACMFSSLRDSIVEACFHAMPDC
jgi:hypothetical protein